MNQAPLFESLKNTVSDKTDFCALLQPNLQEAPPYTRPFPSNQQTAPTISATGLTAYSLFPPFFSRTRSSDNLTPRRHWCDPDILLLTNGNDSPQARFQPAGLCPLHHSIPLPDQNYFPFFAFSHPCSITQTIFLCHPPGLPKDEYYLPYPHRRNS